MALDDIDQEMEELDELPNDEAAKDESKDGPAPGNTRKGGGGLVKAAKKYGKWACMIVIAAILAYFLLNPYGGKGTKVPVPMLMYDLGEQIVNLQDGDAGLVLNISIEVNHTDCIKDVIAKSPILMDRVISMLSMKTPEDLDSVVEINRLKRELLDDFNLQLKLDDGRLTNIYFRKFYYFKTDKPPIRN